MNVYQENRIISKIESHYLKNKFRETYIALEELNFSWTKEELFDFECMWDEGATLDELAEYFERTPEEILILALDRGMKGKIKPRKGGLIGALNSR